jgi:hypothetical protein
MADDGFDKVQKQLETIASELKNATDPKHRRTLLRDMSRLVGEAERISSQPGSGSVSDYRLIGRWLEVN